jgi:hypothetical protein
MVRHVSTVMTFAQDPAVSARWWAQALDARVHADADG